MPAINVNPTRQELTRLKGRLKTSIRGHKLLKDKRDELMKQFMDVVRENRALRAKVEAALIRAHGSFTVASAVMSSEMLEQSLLYPKQSVELDMGMFSDHRKHFCDHLQFQLQVDRFAFHLQNRSF